MEAVTMVEERKRVIPTDPRDPAWGYPRWPESIVTFRQHQLDACAEIMELFDGGCALVLLDAPTGCLTGDTMIGINRAGKAFQIRLDELVRKSHGGKPHGGRGWDLTIPTRVQYSDGETMRLGVMEDAYESGEKLVYELQTEARRSIKATLDHRFQTDAGWRRLVDIEVGDKVYVNEGQGGHTRNHKPQYRVRNNLFHHPYAARRNVNPDKGGHSVVVHRLVIEAEINEMELEAYIARLKFSADGLLFLDPAMQVHHKDEDSFNNDRSNLEVMTESEHHRQHGHDGKWRQVGFHIGLDVVRSVTLIGPLMTYDIAMTDEPHNFIANEFVVHNSGKTIIAEMVRRLLAAKRGAYVANTNSLLDQFQRDFPYAAPIKGRSHYATLDNPKLFDQGRDSISAAECTLTVMELPGCDTCTIPDEATDEHDEDDANTRVGPHCEYCHPVPMCPYRKAKEFTRDHPIAVTNTAYFVTEAGLDDGDRDYNPSVMSRRGLVIIDECDTLESILMSQIEVNISKTMIKKIGLEPPEKKTVLASWVAWAKDEAEPKVKAALDRIPKKGTPKEKKERETMQRLYDRVVNLASELERENAVYDGYSDGAIIFKPIKVDQSAEKMVWSKAKRFLCMSATTFPDEFLDSLGVNASDMRHGLVVVPSTFPTKRRPIYIKPIANNSYKERDTAWPAMVGGLTRVFDKHPDDRTLVHTVSYGFTEFLMGELLGVDRPIFTYTRANERERALERYRSTKGAILLAPSMARGIDLPGDDCRVIAIPKIPYASTADKQISARMYTPGGQRWYMTQTIKSLIQMTGRGMRSADDWCDAYILDRQFIANIYKNGKKLIPEWWLDSVNFSGGGI